MCTSFESNISHKNGPPNQRNQTIELCFDLQETLNRKLIEVRYMYIDLKKKPDKTFPSYHFCHFYIYNTFCK